MKIDRTGPARPAVPAKRSEKSGRAQGASFSQHLKPGTDSATGITAAAPVTTVDALLTIQEVQDSATGQARARARKWGSDVLDRLDRLRIGLIEGTIPRHELERIAVLVDRQRARTDDPALEAILDEIELRAKVELAKLDRAG